MRLVQRHGRIDRIGSEHAEVFIRCYFPTGTWKPCWAWKNGCSANPSRPPRRSASARCCPGSPGGRSTSLKPATRSTGFAVRMPRCSRRSARPRCRARSTGAPSRDGGAARLQRRPGNRGQLVRLRSRAPPMSRTAPRCRSAAGTGAAARMTTPASVSGAAPAGPSCSIRYWNRRRVGCCMGNAYQLGPGRHTDRAPGGLWARVMQRLLALNAAILHNWLIGAPVNRSQIASGH